MNLAVVGTRTFKQAHLLIAFLDEARALHTDLVIVSGDASGADRMAAAYARSYRIPLILFPADWETHGRAAGPIRNRQIVDKADSLVAFWDEESPGTRSSLEMAVEKGIPAVVVTTDGKQYAYSGTTEDKE